MAAPAIPPRALALLALLTLVWGTNWPLFPIVLAEVSVWTFRLFTVPTAGLLLLAIARWRGQSLVVPRRHWATLGLATFCYMTVWHVTSAWSAALIPSGQSAVLGFTMPLWLALINWALLGQRPDRRMGLALALGALGVGLLVQRGLLAYAQAPLGLALGLTAGIGWAAGTLILKRNGGMELPATVITGWQLLASALPIGLVALAVDGLPQALPTWPTLGLMLYITLVPTCIGNVAWFAIVGMLPAQLAGLSSILVPVVAMLSGAVIHGEPLGPLQLAAMGCCSGALWLALGRRS
jgi:drug/metabolite transporter (DMT)-like permease